MKTILVYSFSPDDWAGYQKTLEPLFAGTDIQIRNESLQNHGLKRRGAYPAGLEMIAIPFQKLDEVVTALGEMPWTAIAFRGDEESKKELRARMDRWQEMAEELGSTVNLH